MAMVITTNISSLNAQRQLAGSANKLGTAMERLSSGLRINSAKDDAAGLAISSRMTTQITGLNVAQRNANDGISLAQTAEGALSTVGNNLQRIRELAVQSRNATNSDDDRASLQKEVTQLTAEIDRVAKNTQFNGTNLLDGSFTAKAFQVGANQGQTIEIASIVNAQTENLGEWKSVAVAARKTNVELPVGTATPSNTGTSGNWTAASSGYGAGTLKVDGVEVLSMTTSAGNQATAAKVDEAIVAKRDQLAAKGISWTGTAAGGDLMFSKADGTEFKVDISASLGSFATAGFVAQTANGTTAFPGLAAGDLTINGVDVGAIGEATSLSDFGAKLQTAINGKFPGGNVTATVVNGKLSLESDSADLVIAGTAPAKAGLSAETVSFKAAGNQTGFKNVDISTVDGADNAILAMDAALKSVNSARADLGAIQNRFESVVSNLATTSENLTASRSRIQDADFALETANLSSAQVLQQAGTAMVAQANQLPQNVLSLLR